MTNLEAIAFFMDMDECTYGGSEPIQMAIEALKHEPCEDAISRQEVVEFLKNHANDFEDVKVRMAFKAASSLVENADNIPPVTPTRKKGRWIDTKEISTNRKGQIVHESYLL